MANAAMPLPEQSVQMTMAPLSGTTHCAPAPTTTEPVTTTTSDPYSEEICKQWKEDNNIEYQLQSNKGKVTTRGVNTYQIRAKRNKINEQNDYTGFITWGKKNCGRDFIDKLADGSTM